MGRAVPACVPRLQAQARPKACRVPGTAHLARAVPGPWRAVPACSRAGLFGPARLASYIWDVDDQCIGGVWRSDHGKVEVSRAWVAVARSKGRSRERAATKFFYRSRDVPVLDPPSIIFIKISAGFILSFHISDYT